MKDISETKILKTNKKDVLYYIMVISCVILFSLSSLVITPIYVNVSTNIVTSVTALPAILEIILEILDILAFAFCYATVIYSACMRTFSKTLRLCIIYVTACFVRRCASLLITGIIYSGVSDTDIFSVILYLILETAQIAIVATLANSAAKKYHERRVEIKKAADIVGDVRNIPKIDFSKVFSKDNPMLVSVLKSGILLSAIKIVTRIIYDINYGAPSGFSEILIMSVYYFSDLLICVIFYTVCWLFLSKLYRKEIQS